MEHLGTISINPEIEIPWTSPVASGLMRFPFGFNFQPGISKGEKKKPKDEIGINIMKSYEITKHVFIP